jgi:hypothetical protein
MNSKSLEGFGPVGTNGPDRSEIVTVILNFGMARVGSASFRGTIVKFFVERDSNTMRYAEWLNNSKAQVYVNGLHECVKDNDPAAFVEFMKDMLDWNVENANIKIVVVS